MPNLLEQLATLDDAVRVINHNADSLRDLSAVVDHNANCGQAIVDRLNEVHRLFDQYGEILDMWADVCGKHAAEIKELRQQNDALKKRHDELELTCAKEEGGRAQERGVDYLDCPYHPDDRRSDAWGQGWHDAHWGCI